MIHISEEIKSVKTNLQSGGLKLCRGENVARDRLYHKPSRNVMETEEESTSNLYLLQMVDR